MPLAQMGREGGQTAQGTPFEKGMPWKSASRETCQHEAARKGNETGGVSGRPNGNALSVQPPFRRHPA